MQLVNFPGERSFLFVSCPTREPVAVRGYWSPRQRSYFKLAILIFYLFCLELRTTFMIRNICGFSRSCSERSKKQQS